MLYDPQKQKTNITLSFFSMTIQNPKKHSLLNHLLRRASFLQQLLCMGRQLLGRCLHVHSRWPCCDQVLQLLGHRRRHLRRIAECGPGQLRGQAQTPHDGYGWGTSHLRKMVSIEYWVLSVLG